MNIDQISQDILWTPDLDKLIRKWKKQISKRERGHAKLSRKFQNRHYVFGIPATLLAGLISTGIISTFKNCDEDIQGSKQCNADTYIRFTAGIITMLNGSIAAFQTFMNYSGKSEQHKTAADEYGSLYRTLDTLLLIPGDMRGNPIDVLQNIRTQYDDLIRKSPTVEEQYDTDLSYEYVATNNANTQYSNSSTPNYSHTANLHEENNHDTSDEEKEISICVDLDTARSRHRSLTYGSHSQHNSPTYYAAPSINYAMTELQQHLDRTSPSRSSRYNIQPPTFNSPQEVVVPSPEPQPQLKKPTRIPSDDTLSTLTE